VFEGLGGTLSFSNRIDEAEETYAKMRTIAELLGADEMRVSAMNKAAFIYGMRRGELDRADRALKLSEEVALSCNDVQGQAERHMTNCYIQTTLGEFDQAYDSLQFAARIGRETDDLEARLFGLTHIANTLLYMGRFDESFAMANEALELALETGHKMWEAELKSFAISFYHLRNGDLDTSYKFAEEGANIAARIGAGQGEAAGRFMQSLIARMRGRFDEALEIGGQALTVSRASGLAYFEAAMSAQLASIELDISTERATVTAQLHQQALEALDKPLGTAIGAMAWAELGFCALTLGDAETAAKMFDNGLTISTAARILAKPQLLMGLAMLQMMGGDMPGAHSTLDEAQGLAEADGMHHYTPFFGLVRGMMQGAAGESESALESFNESKTEALRLGMLPVALQANTAIAGIAVGQNRRPGGRRHIVRM
jgi:tetratricopeptide (TPR) repeat protein